MKLSGLQGVREWWPRARHSKWMKRLAIGAVVVMVLLWKWFVNPLPSDESMIAHFQAHRAEFEELVRLYREFKNISGQPVRHWKDEPTAKALMKQAKIRDVGTSFASVGTFLPDPYAPDGNKRLLEIIHEATKAKIYYLEFVRHYSSLVLLPSDAPPFGTVTLRYPAIGKWYIHIPAEPIIKDGMLWEAPLHPVFGPLKYRVFNSLNDYPPNWGPMECVYRKIETHWFLCMCRIPV